MEHRDILSATAGGLIAASLTFFPLSAMAQAEGANRAATEAEPAHSCQDLDGLERRQCLGGRALGEDNSRAELARERGQRRQQEPEPDTGAETQSAPIVAETEPVAPVADTGGIPDAPSPDQPLGTGGGGGGGGGGASGGGGLAGLAGLAAAAAANADDSEPIQAPPAGDPVSPPDTD